MIDHSYNIDTNISEYQQKFIIPSQFLKSYGISLEQTVYKDITLHDTLKKLYLQLCWYVNKSYKAQKRNYAYVKQETLAKTFDRTVDTISRLLRKLKNMGYIEIEKSKSKINRYYILNFLDQKSSEIPNKISNEMSNDHQPELFDIPKVESEFQKPIKKNLRNLDKTKLTNNIKRDDKKRKQPVKEKSVSLFKNSGIVINIEFDRFLKQRNINIKNNERLKEIDQILKRISLPYEEFIVILDSYVKKNSKTSYNGFMYRILENADIESIIWQYKKDQGRKRMKRESLEKSKYIREKNKKDTEESYKFENSMPQAQMAIQNFKEKYPEKYKEFEREIDNSILRNSVITKESILYKAPFVLRMSEKIDQYLLKFSKDCYLDDNDLDSILQVN